MFVDAADTIRALSSFEFDELENIDKIYFEPTQGQFTLIFDRSVIDAIKERQKINQPGAAELLLEYIRYQLQNKNTDAFDCVKSITSASGNISWLSDDGAKEALVRLGEELVSKGALGEAMWIVQQLEHDPDPDPTGETDRYHLMVLRSEQTGVITTVRGHLCWLMAKLVVQNKAEYYTEIIAIIKRYATDQNLYIKKQVAIPLGELLARRKATKNSDGSAFD